MKKFTLCSLIIIFSTYVCVSNINNIIIKTENKNELIVEIDKYIDKYSNNKSNLDSKLLLLLCDKHSIDIKLVLAQGLQESHFGTKGIATKTNNIWNVGAYDNYTYNKISKIFKTDCVNNSIEPYLLLLKNRYLINNKTTEDLLNNFVDVNNNRYASNKNYERYLKYHIKTIKNNYKIDSLYQIHLSLNR